jgi:hypothetical protein
MFVKVYQSELRPSESMPNKQTHLIGSDLINGGLRLYRFSRLSPRQMFICVSFNLTEQWVLRNVVNTSL